MPWFDAGPRSFSGHDLIGDRLVRIVHMDEAGISTQEPFAVVGAVVVNADQQWKAVGRRLKILAHETVPENLRQDFRFHATELYSGGKTFPRETKGGPSAEVRWQILERVLAIPSAMNLPVVIGHAVKKEAGDRKAQAIAAHTMAFIYALLGVERYMRRHAAPDEVAMIVAEDNHQARATLAAAQHVMQDEEAARSLLPASMHGELPLARIIEAPLFAKKATSPLLQLADACSFLFKRHQERQRDNERFLRAFLGNSGCAIDISDPLNSPVNHSCFLWNHA